MKAARIIRVAVGGALLLTLAVLVGARTQWPPLYFLGLAVAAVAMLGWWIAKRQGSLFGPHFFYDLIRLARRSRTRDLRILYGLALLLGLGLIYWFRFPHEPLATVLFGTRQGMTINDASHFAEVFVFTVIVVQNLTVLLLTPVYVGSAITEEKEKKTLDLLFATQMKDREIVLGKLFSRLTHLGAILLGGLPVLSLAQLWGGIDFGVLVANFINTGLILLSVGCVSILVSVLCRKVVNAVMIIYGFVLPVTGCLGIFSIGGRTSVLGLAQSDVGADPAMMSMVLFGLAAFHGMIAVVCVTVALLVMRGQHGGDDYFNPQPVVIEPHRRRRERQAPMEHQMSLQIDRLYELPPLNNDPLYWKEIHVGLNVAVMQPLFFTMLGLSVAMLALSFLAMQLGFEHRPWFERSHEMGIMIRVVSILWALWCCVGVGYTAASAIVRERQQGTLEALLTLPIPRRDIMSRKWLGNMFRPWRWWICLTVILGMGTILTGIHFAGGMLFLAAVMIHAAFFASLGLFLSVVSKSVLSAHGKMALLIVALMFGTWLLSEIISGGSRNDVYGNFLRYGLNPVRTWWLLSFSWKEFSDPDSTLDSEFGGALMGLGCYMLLAILFWLLANWRFGKERSWRAE